MRRARRAVRHVRLGVGPDLDRSRQCVLFTAFAVTWTGARVFDGRKPLPMLLFAGAGLWLVVGHLPAFAERSTALPAQLRHHHDL